MSLISSAACPDGSTVVLSQFLTPNFLILTQKLCEDTMSFNIEDLLRIHTDQKSMIWKQICFVKNSINSGLTLNLVISTRWTPRCLLPFLPSFRRSWRPHTIKDKGRERTPLTSSRPPRQVSREGAGATTEDEKGARCRPWSL